MKAHAINVSDKNFREDMKFFKKSLEKGEVRISKPRPMVYPVIEPDPERSKFDVFFEILELERSFVGLDPKIPAKRLSELETKNASYSLNHPAYEAGQNFCQLASIFSREVISKGKLTEDLEVLKACQKIVSHYSDPKALTEKVIKKLKSEFEKSRKAEDRIFLRDLTKKLIPYLVPDGDLTKAYQHVKSLELADLEKMGAKPSLLAVIAVIHKLMGSKLSFREENLTILCTGSPSR